MWFLQQWGRHRWWFLHTLPWHVTQISWSMYFSKAAVPKANLKPGWACLQITAMIPSAEHLSWKKETNFVFPDLQAIERAQRLTSKCQDLGIEIILACFLRPSREWESEACIKVYRFDTHNLTHCSFSTWLVLLDPPPPFPCHNCLHLSFCDSDLFRFKFFSPFLPHSLPSGELTILGELSGPVHEELIDNMIQTLDHTHTQSMI